MKKRLVSIGEKVYDGDLMEKEGINDAQLKYLFEEDSGWPHGDILSLQDIKSLTERHLVTDAGEMMQEGHDVLVRCETSVDCATCIHYHSDEDGECCLLYDVVARHGEYCRDWEENI